MTNISSVSPTDFSALVAFTKEHSINFLIPGPEAPLVAGIVDYFRKHAPGIGCFGPSKAAALMEGSKTFSKDFMKRHNILTAAYENFANYDKARKYLDVVDHDVVIKADGLAAGKGVIIPQNKEEAHAALKEIMLDREFGAAGEKVVIEEFMTGEEVSILSFSDGKTIRSLPPAQDHKRIGDGDTGPNTGGMGTYAPTQVVTKEQIAHIEKTILQPTIDGMREEGETLLPIVDRKMILTTCRLPIRRLPFHWPHDDTQGSASTRIQRSLWRPRDAECFAPAPDGSCRAHGCLYHGHAWRSTDRH